MNKIKNRTSLFVGIALFILLFCDLILAAAFKNFWLDETAGITTALYGFATLLKYCPGQASPFPLYYLLEKLWILIWNDTPQAWWDLRIFFRISTAFCWALSSSLVFIAAYKWLQRANQNLVKKLPALLISLTVALYFYLNPLMYRYLAIESRPYSLWVLLTLFQIIVLVETVIFYKKEDFQNHPNSSGRKLGTRLWLAQTLIALALASVAAVGATQVALAFFVYLVMTWKKEKLMSHFKRAWHAAPAAGVFLYYLSVTETCANEPSPVRAFAGAMLRLFASQFQIQIFKGDHLIESTVMMVFIFVFCYIVFSRVKKESTFHRTVGLYIFGFLCMTPIFYLGSRAKNVLVAPRHYIALLPGLLWFTFYLAKTTLEWTAQRMSLDFNRLVTVSCILVLSFSSIRFVSDLISNVIRFEWKTAIRYTPDPLCLKRIPYDEDKFNQMNQYCRKSASETK